MSAEYWAQWDSDEIVSMLDIPNDVDVDMDMNEDENLTDSEPSKIVYTYMFMEEW